MRDGTAFPQEDEPDLASGAAFFASQTHCGVAVEDEKVLGLYILHPNNVGRCKRDSTVPYYDDSGARLFRTGRRRSAS